MSLFHQAIRLIQFIDHEHGAISQFLPLYVYVQIQWNRKRGPIGTIPLKLSKPTTVAGLYFPSSFTGQGFNPSASLLTSSYLCHRSFHQILHGNSGSITHFLHKH
eukprot:scaffold254324_cov15-Tisochrysis_lutea.AAC.1